jgi:hypothetical protein
VPALAIGRADVGAGPDAHDADGAAAGVEDALVVAHGGCRWVFGFGWGKVGGWLLAAGSWLVCVGVPLKKGLREGVVDGARGWGWVAAGCLRCLTWSCRGES